MAVTAVTKYSPNLLSGERKNDHIKGRAELATHCTLGDQGENRCRGSDPAVF
jgi:hypothetical protein